MATCIVYLRRSSNRDDKQANSLDFQKKWAYKILWEMPELDVIWLDWRICNIQTDWFIYESHSAKERWIPRPFFNKMIDTIKTFGVDWVLVWGPDRISRNSQDMVNFIGLLARDNPKIRIWIITDHHKYLTWKTSDMNNLEQLLLNAKIENENRAERAREQHKYNKIENWIFTHKYPFWYWTYGKGNLYIKEDEEKLYILAVNMRLSGCSWKEISDEFTKNEFTKNWDSIKKMLANPFYYWEFNCDWRMIEINQKWYRPFIDKQTFNKLTSYNEENIRPKPNPIQSEISERIIDYMIFDAWWRPLQWYKNSKTNSVFYREPTKNPNYKISISEAKLFKEANNQIHRFVLPASFIAIMEAQLQPWLQNSLREKNRGIDLIRSQIIDVETQIEWLSSRVAKTNDDKLVAVYEKQLILNLDKQKQLNDELDKLKNQTIDIEKTIKRYTNIFKDLPWTFKKVSKKEKADILRGLWIYFIVWPDKNITLMGWDFENLFIS